MYFFQKRLYFQKGYSEVKDNQLGGLHREEKTNKQATQHRVCLSC